MFFEMRVRLIVFILGLIYGFVIVMSEPVVRKSRHRGSEYGEY